MKTSRRDWLMLTGLTAGTSLLAALSLHAAQKKDKSRFRFALNTSTIMGQNLDIVDEIETAAKAGYDAIEPWMDKLYAYKKAGGSLPDLRKRIKDHGLVVESAIGFANWIVDDDRQRQKGFEDAKRDMDLLAQIGGKRIAAPPAGAENKIDLLKAAERYADLLTLGDSMGVIPQIEMWGGHPAIGTISTAIYIAIQSGHPKACFLGDAYHTYKGGCDFDGLKLLGPQALQVFHFNDYPADPPRETINDSHRVFPGDGIAPLTDILKGFAASGAYPVLSLEVFNRTYWEWDALKAAKTGLEKMKKIVAAAAI
jgi:2-keto-myo-inositol isomerase